MEIYVYDVSLNLKGVIDEISSFLWTRRYWECGEFKLLVPYSEYNASLIKNGNIIMKIGDNEAAQINYIKIKKNAYGMEEIEAQGKFITCWLDTRIIINQIIQTDTTQCILNKIVSENLISPTNQRRTIPFLELYNGIISDTKIIKYTSVPFSSCLTAAEDLAKANGYGFKIQTDVRTKKHIFVPYRGKDLSVDQSICNPCIFANEFDNIYEQEYENSIENIRSVCYVGGEETDTAERQIVEIGTAAGLNRKELFVDASDISQNNQSEYIQYLTERGINLLEQYSETLNFSSKVNLRSNLEYKSDFDVGDIVTCMNRKWGIKINVRITEITETYQKNDNSLDVTFGEGFPTLLKKIKMMR